MKTGFYKMLMAIIPLLGLMTSYNNAFAQTNAGGKMPEIIKFGTNDKAFWTPYDAAIGAGLDNFAQSDENAFSVRLKEGNYLVNLEVVADKPAQILVFTEDRRMMSGLIDLKPNKPKKLSFYANVKTPDIAYAEQDANSAPKVGLRGDENISRNWDDKLTIELSSKAAHIKSLEISAVKMPKILIAGDSTLTDQAGGDYASWGQFIPYFIPQMPIINHARSGETLKSFLFSLRWDKLLSQVAAGDIVLIQFGHNDEKAQWARTYSAADGAFPKYLAAFAADVKQRGGIPVLISPVARLRLGADGKNENTHKNYDSAVAQTAKEMGIGFIDLTRETTIFYEALGRDKAALAFGDYGKDKTHHNYYGAYFIANMVAQDLAGLMPDKITSPAQKFNPAAPPAPETFFIKPEMWVNMRPPQSQTLGHEPVVKTK